MSPAPPFLFHFRPPSRVGTIRGAPPGGAASKMPRLPSRPRDHDEARPRRRPDPPARAGPQSPRDGSPRRRGQHRRCRARAPRAGPARAGPRAGAHGASGRARRGRGRGARTDLAFFLGREAVLRIPADAVLPYDDLSPDRGVEMERLAALARLHLAPDAAKAVVVSARALARRVVPRRVFEAGADLLGKGVTIEREALAAKLVLARLHPHPARRGPGHLRDARRHRGSVEPGGSGAGPARALRRRDRELPCLRPADAAQRGRRRGGAPLPGARGALLRRGEGGGEARGARRRGAGEPADVAGARGARRHRRGDAVLRDGGAPPRLPPRRARDPLRLPAALARRSTWTTSPASRRRSPSSTRSSPASTRGRSGARSWRSRPRRTSSPPRTALAPLAERPLVRRHRVWLGTAEPIRFSLEDTPRLRGEIEAAHGDEGALAPLTRRLEDWRRRGVAAVVACGSPSTADRLRRLLEDRRQAVRAHEGRARRPAGVYDPAVHAHVFAGEISPGFVDGEARLAVVSDEEIFGRRVRRRRAARRTRTRSRPRSATSTRATSSSTSSTGSPATSASRRCRSAGWRATSSSSPTTAPTGSTCRSRSCARCRSSPAPRPETIRLDRLGGQSFALRKARVKEQLLKMAAELLDIYAARAAHPGFALPGAGRDLPRVRGGVPLGRDARPGEGDRRRRCATCARSAAASRGADGPARLRRRRLRQDRGRDARRDARRALEEAGGGARADDRARLASTSAPSASASRATRSGSRRSRG